MGSGHATRRRVSWPNRWHIHCVALVVSVRGNERPSGVTWRESIQPLPLSRQAACDTFLAIAGQKYKNDVHLDILLAAIDYVPLAVTLMAYAAEAEPNLTGIWQRWQQERTEMLRRADGKERLTNIEISYEISIEGSRMTDEGRRLLALMAYLPNGVALKSWKEYFPLIVTEPHRCCARLDWLLTSLVGCVFLLHCASMCFESIRPIQTT